MSNSKCEYLSPASVRTADPDLDAAFVVKGSDPASRTTPRFQNYAILRMRTSIPGSSFSNFTSWEVSV